MKSKFLLYVLVALSMTFIFYGHSGERTKKLQAMHRQIGNNLIKIKKEHPQSQTLVYSLLDQLGKYYAFSKDLLGKKKEYKQLLNAELSNSEILKKDMGDMRKKMTKMKQVILSVHRKMKKDSERADKLEEEKELLAREKDAFLREKEKFEIEREQLIAERDTLFQERNALIKNQSDDKVKSHKNDNSCAKESVTKEVMPERRRGEAYASVEKPKLLPQMQNLAKV